MTATNGSDGEWEQFIFRPNKSGGAGVSKEQIVNVSMRNASTPSGDSDWLQIGASYYDRCSAENMVMDISEVYVDSTRARVEIGNASSWTACVFSEIQICSAWTSTSITVSSINAGHFGDTSTAYLYVHTSSGAVNANGFQVTFSSSVGGGGGGTKYGSSLGGLG